MVSLVLTEKYRPLTLDEVVGQPVVIEVLKGMVEAQKSGKMSMPNLLFNGPPGTGKTTCARALARELLGEKWQACFVDMNASDDRKIETMRTTVKQISNSASFGPFNIIFLDEADNLTGAAQFALRRIMEDATNCKFILSCNYMNKIIEPIQDRCSMLNFRPLDSADIKSYLTRICKAEGMNLSPDAIHTISTSCRKNMRQALNVLSQVSMLKDQSTEKILGLLGVKGHAVNKIYETAMAGNPEKAAHFFTEQYYEGLSPEFTMEWLFDCIKNDQKIDIDTKAYMITRWADYQFYVTQGGSITQQMQSLIWFIATASRRKKDDKV